MVEETAALPTGQEAQSDSHTRTLSAPVSHSHRQPAAHKPDAISSRLNTSLTQNSGENLLA